MKVAVTSKHIKAGNPQDEYKCALALAIVDAFKAQGLKDVEISVDGDIAFVNFGVKLNSACLKFVEGFDAEKPQPDDYKAGEEDKEYKSDMKGYEKLRKNVKPFEFDLKN